VTLNATYNAANELINNNGSTYSYDANGNETQVGSAVLGYNAANQTTSSTGFGSTSPVNFSYRGEGQSERSATTQTGTSSTFESSLLGVISETDNGATTYFTRDSMGRLLDIRTGGNTYTYVLDGSGSVVALTGYRGQINTAYSYDPFGQVTTIGTSVANPWRFGAGYLDPTGFYKMGERYYDPSTGRFTQQDRLVKLVDPMQWNRYVYVGDNPVNFVDPSGTCGVGDNIAGFLAGGSGTATVAGGLVIGSATGLLAAGAGSASIESLGDTMYGILLTGGIAGGAIVGGVVLIVGGLMVAGSTCAE
jgi:RHS repeat-associated protein